MKRVVYDCHTHKRVVTLRTFVREYFTTQPIIKICADSPSAATIHSLTMISAQATACPSLLSPLSQNFTAKNLFLYLILYLFLYLILRPESPEFGAFARDGGRLLFGRAQNEGVC
ncbi:Hypothetical_protein [Hexamita inflata]|uniref:Hypothetical_protein n=1 Tax=Hexamita inflata TaxID=28002 RepID=A0AA86NN67_9EUKA|nr:Hypothetical protein HINF_LOCUS10284 [Hexamita inflata]